MFSWLGNESALEILRLRKFFVPRKIAIDHGRTTVIKKTCGVKVAVNVEEEVSDMHIISAYWTGHPEHSEGMHNRV